MTKSRPVSDEVVLHELMPLVEKSLDRHVGAANEWFPHDYVPYEEGRNFVKEPWRPEDSRLPDIAQTALEINLLTEDNLPYYHLALWRTFGEEEAWGEWVRRWTAEEGRHAIVIRDYLTVTRGCDPKALEQGRMDQALRGWYPEFAEQGPLDGVVFTTLQELATRISHRNTGAITDDETAEKLCSRVATDENLHYVFYRDMAVQAIQMNPSAMVEAMHRQITNFAMPGAGIPGFREKAKAMAQAGIYNLRIHLDQVLRPVLDNHWRLADIEGLSDEAKQKREDIYTHLERLDRVAARLGEPLGPVRGDLSNDPLGQA
ncbi:MAG: acyl-ACP desaturase [Actinomycetota bacterium]|jgi:acyl-[acyl-carrier-protein] desaturase